MSNGGVFEIKIVMIIPARAVINLLWGSLVILSKWGSAELKGVNLRVLDVKKV